MRGRFLHNKILIAAVEERFLALGATVSREHSVKVRDRICYVDLFVSYGDSRIACEAELTTDRILNDIAKAIALDADMLLILVPTSTMARKVQERLTMTMPGPSLIAISVLPLGVALERLRNRTSFLTLLNVPHRKRNQSTMKTGTGVFQSSPPKGSICQTERC